MKKDLLVLVLLFALIFSFVSCGNKKQAAANTPAAPVEVVKTEQVVQPEAEKTPVAAVVEEPQAPITEEVVILKEEEPAAEPETASVEEVVEKVEEVEEVEEVVVITPIKKTYELYGYTLDVEAGVGKAVITYPSILTKEDLVNAYAAIAPKYADLLKDVYYEFDGNTLILYYPETWAEAEFAYAETLIATDLVAYVDSVIAQPVTEPVVEETVVAAEPVVETIVEPVVEEVVTVAEPVVAPAVEPVVEPVVETAAEEELGRSTHKIILSVEPVTLHCKKDVCYGFGVAATYEYRLYDSLGLDGSVVYNMYIPKNDKFRVISDHAIIIDALAYGDLTEHFEFFAGMGGGINLFREGKTVEWDGILRVTMGVEAKLSDVFSLRLSSDAELSFRDGNDKFAFHPAKLGVQFTF